jgi:hypothetical protein
MAYPTKVTIRSGKTVYAGDPDGEGITSRFVQVSVTYALERSDDDLLASVARKAREVEAAHLAVWRQVRREQGELALRPAPAGFGDDAPPELVDGRGPHDDPGPPDDPRPDDDDPLPSYARDEDEEKDEEGGFVPPSDEVPFTEGPSEDGPTEYPADRNAVSQGSAERSITGNGAAPTSNGSGPRPVPVTKPQKLAIGGQARRLGLSDVALAETIRRRYSKTSHTPRFAVDRLTKKEGEDLLRALAALEPVLEAAHP